MPFATPLKAWLVLLGVALCAAPPPAPAEVVVVGTVHQATPAYTPDRLLQILQRLKPDVILLELDSSFFTRGHRLMDYASSSMEQKAVRAYLAATGAQVRPFDLEGRNEFYRRTDFFNKEDALFARIEELRQAGTFTPEAERLRRDIWSQLERRDRWMREAPERINTFACDADLCAKTWYWDQGMAELIRLTPRLREFAAFQDQATAFEARRSDAMVANIRRWAREFPGRRLVVVTGFEHRHELRRQLRAQEAPAGFVVKEFWE